MGNRHTIFGIHVIDRMKKAGDIQKVFTTYGCNIKTRMGLHEVHENSCLPGGLILLEVIGDGEELKKFEKALAAIKGIEVKKMVFTHV
jgi:hypothetical protein